jgi:hypothetical protein
MRVSMGVRRWLIAFLLVGCCAALPVPAVWAGYKVTLFPWEYGPELHHYMVYPNATAIYDNRIAISGSNTC